MVHLFQLLISVLALATVYLIWPHLPSADRAEYFQFADQRIILGIPNFMDVISNFGFLIVGVYGAVTTYKNKSLSKFYSIMGYLISAAIVFTFLGSSYFHLNVTTERLFWDRLPMSFAFGSIVTLLAVDRLKVKQPLLLGVFIIGAALISVIGWRLEWFSLKPYLVTQFGSILLSIAIISIRKKGFVENRYVWLCIGFYAMAKFFEHFDTQIYSLGELISGHSLKHIISAVGIYYLFGFTRQKVNKLNYKL